MRIRLIIITTVLISLFDDLRPKRLGSRVVRKTQISDAFNKIKYKNQTKERKDFHS